MPTIFNLREYSFQSVANPSSDAFSSSFQITTTDSDTIATLLDSDTKGPSLMFFYTISGSDSSDFPINNIKGTLVNEFSAKVKKEPFGVNNPIYHELVFKKLSDDTKVSLYEFKGFNNQKFSFPNMILKGNSTIVVPKIQQFTVQAKPTSSDPSRYYIELKVITDNPSGSFTPTSVDLYSFEGSSFLSKSEDILACQTGEYVYLPDGASDIYLNIFCAFTVTGDFTNIFWSNLTFLDQIKLPLP